jgi:hypothetical protein
VTRLTWILEGCGGLAKELGGALSVVCIGDRLAVIGCFVEAEEDHDEFCITCRDGGCSERVLSTNVGG